MVQTDILKAVKGAHSLGQQVEKNERFWLGLLLESNHIAKFIFSKYCDIIVYVCLHGIVHQRRCTIIGEGECNIPTIIPSLINA
jgi:hypothetical protein